MCSLAGAVADGFVSHPTSSHPKVLAERIIPSLTAGGRKPRLIAVPKMITGKDPAAILAQREAVRSELAFLYSTPAYRVALEVLGLSEVGEELTVMARAGDWARLPAVLTDDVLDRLVTQCTYAELPEVLSSKYASLCDGIALAVWRIPPTTASSQRCVRRFEPPQRLPRDVQSARTTLSTLGASTKASMKSSPRGCRLNRCSSLPPHRCLLTGWSIAHPKGESDRLWC